MVQKLKIILTENQWERVSEISGNLGIVSLASIVLPYIFEKPDLARFLLGLLVTILLWYTSLVSAKKY